MRIYKNKTDLVFTLCLFPILGIASLVYLFIWEESEKGSVSFHVTSSVSIPIMPTLLAMKVASALLLLIVFFSVYKMSRSVWKALLIFPLKLIYTLFLLLVGSVAIVVGLIAWGPFIKDESMFNAVVKRGLSGYVFRALSKSTRRCMCNGVNGSDVLTSDAVHRHGSQRQPKPKNAFLNDAGTTANAEGMGAETSED